MRNAPKYPPTRLGVAEAVRDRRAAQVDRTRRAIARAEAAGRGSAALEAILDLDLAILAVCEEKVADEMLAEMGHTAAALDLDAADDLRQRHAWTAGDDLLESEVGQWAAGTYRLADGRTVVVAVDGTGRLKAAEVVR